ncbi:MAG: M48 family metallopeptidase [Rhodospirillales bacterium]|nr:M48 family metallopeptidase [Rhodospirillales bacterium]
MVRKCALLLLVLVLLLRPEDVFAAKISFIRDTEIENTIRAYATPLFIAAGLDPTAVRIYVVADKQINAFVAGGQNLFINTGLITRSGDADQIIGVIAHEVGHIEGGHLSRVNEALKRSTAESILSFVLGAAAAAAGRPDVGGAMIMGGQNVAQRNFFQYSRTQEGAADAAAMRYLDATDQSARGLLDFFNILSQEELLVPERQDPYLRTHPLTRDRIDAMEAFVAKSPHSNAPTKPDFQTMYARMVAKLHGFLDLPATTYRLYPPEDTSIPARYARAIADYRSGDTDKAVATVDGLIAEEPKNPYFHELKGQILFEAGRPAQALKPYETAVQLMSDAPLIRVNLARVELALNDPKLLNPAVANLRAALAVESETPFVWRQLAIGLGRQGDMANSSLALAEEAMLLNKRSDAKYHAGKAAAMLPQGSPGWLKAQDILHAVEVEKGD